MQDVIALITSLSSSEKQHFKKRHKPDSDFIILFDCINKRKTVTNDEALKYLNKKNPNGKVLTSSYLSVVKSYLKNRILESLRVQYFHKGNNYELLSRSINTDILLEKGLYDLAKKELSLASKKVEGSSFPIEQLLLLRRQSLIAYFENYKGVEMEEIHDLFKSRINAAEQLLLEIKFARILSVLGHNYFHGQKDMELLKTFMNEPYMQDESLSSDFSTKYLFHWVHAQFEEFKGDDENAMVHFNRSIKVWVENPKYIEAHPRMYIGACFMFFKYLIHQKEPFSKITSEINFDVLFSKIKTERLSEEVGEKYASLFNLVQILTLRQKMKFNEIIDIVKALTKDGGQMDGLSDYGRVIYYYYAALAFTSLGQYKKANDFLFELLNPLDKRLAVNPVYVTVIIMLHLIILTEISNDKHIAYLIPKYKKYLKKEGRLDSFEEHFLNMVSQLISRRFKHSADLVYKRFYQRLNDARELNDKGLKMEYEYLLSWVKMKMNQEE